MYIAVEIGSASDCTCVPPIGIEDYDGVRRRRALFLLYDCENQPSAFGVDVEAGVANALLAWGYGDDVADVWVDGIDASGLGVGKDDGLGGVRGEGSASVPVDRASDVVVMAFWECVSRSVFGVLDDEAPSAFGGPVFQVENLAGCFLVGC